MINVLEPCSDFVKFMYCTSICKNKMPYSFLTTVGVVSVFLSEVVFFFYLKAVFGHYRNTSHYK